MVSRQHRLLGIFAHPDDESRIVGGTLAKYTSEGVVVSLLFATRGEEGSCGDPPLCTPEELPQVREAELRDACSILGIRDLTILAYRDGSLATVDRAELIGHLVAAIRRIRPQVVLTFGPEGRTLHPDHIAIHEAATAAFELAADSNAYQEQGLPAHAAPKLYYTTIPESLVRATSWKFPGIPDEDVTVSLEIRPWLEEKKRVTNESHRSQAHDQPFGNLPEDARWAVLGTEHFYLAATHDIKHPEREADLFAGLSS
ncbi:MAG: PIG-L family deacetylase [Chloroflexia bacterium]|jgi:LmbE family N-acetylglucosaminyl deacetylase|nr:PIG-L family deacetylase [Chloroflexia bacterium]